MTRMLFPVTAETRGVPVASLGSFTILTKQGLLTASSQHALPPEPPQLLELADDVS